MMIYPLQHTGLADKIVGCQKYIEIFYWSRYPQHICHLTPPPISLPTSSVHSFTAHIIQYFRTQHNAFSLFLQYCLDQRPPHNPEETIDLSNLSNLSTGENGPSQPHNNKTNFHPFPNKNLFLLKGWYWNDGVQKSQDSFNTLLSIVGHPYFCPEDVQHTKWGDIDAILAKNDIDLSRKRCGAINGSEIRHEDEIMDDNGDAEWTDDAAGWKKMPISISIPFHHCMKNPGANVGDLYHRPFVSVTCERLKNPNDNQQFHYEPFELFWKSTNDSADTWVHGELYTSPAFLEAHCALQDSPRELGCNLPHVIAAMMFWLDGTHLTSFGNAKLHPCYLYFGNNSKYQWCKPTCHLSNHVAYFQMVGLCLYLGTQWQLLTSTTASRFIQIFCHQAHRRKSTQQGFHDSLSS
jgi:hypothetical protein